MLSAHVADALKEGRKVEPEYKEVVTVCLSDIVGFTELSGEMDSAKVADMLDRLYTKLDVIAKELDVFKLETIGDAYMAVANLVSDQKADHAFRISLFALRAVDAGKSTLVDPEEPSKGCVQMRVGVNSGPVVAHVVGTSRPKYTLFGDTVKCEWGCGGVRWGGD